MSTKPKIAVIGAGLMGHGIAQVFALAGHAVTITDAHRPTLDSALMRISTNLRDLGDDENAVNRVDRKSTRLNSSHIPLSRMPSSA